MGIWVGKWFKITMRNKGYYDQNSGLSGDRASIVKYLNIASWDPQSKVLQGDLYAQDPATNQWVSEPLSINYTKGSNVDFQFWSQAAGDFTYGFAGRVQGTANGSVVETARINSLGGYHLQVNNEPGSNETWAGWLTVSGKMLPESKVPVEILSP